jgi:hypothetical protein
MDQNFYHFGQYSLFEIVNKDTNEKKYFVNSHTAHKNVYGWTYELDLEKYNEYINDQKYNDDFLSLICEINKDEPKK